MNDHRIDPMERLNSALASRTSYPYVCVQVRVLWTRGVGDNAVASNLTSGPHTMDPDNHSPPAAEALQPGITWACQWNSVEEKDAAWEKLFGEYMPKYFGEDGGNPMSKTGQLEGYKKLRIQFMESWV
eukprot:SAG11_NODE_4250_length_1986_cov_1.946476_5_plen_128_part_00